MPYDSLASANTLEVTRESPEDEVDGGSFGMVPRISCTVLLYVRQVGMVEVGCHAIRPQTWWKLLWRRVGG